MSQEYPMPQDAAVAVRRRRRVSGFDVVLAVVGLVLLLVSVPQLGPAIRAARADGVSGVFTARELRCVQHPGHESCVWAGDFAPAAGGRPARHDVELYGSDRGTLAAGRTVAAVDTGRASRVYGPGGSGEWMFVTLLALAGLGVPAVIGRRVTRNARGPAREPAREPGCEPAPGPVQESEPSATRT
ncbi:hypothetical protein [Nonomuraea sp. NPDC050783]|uniref:hypothetical protein n=1 Tax=Nonomuraea sp. NPDC050783 TaxID=3154634 RepID=UPI003465BC80